MMRSPRWPLITALVLAGLAVGGVAVWLLSLRGAGTDRPGEPPATAVRPVPRLPAGFALTEPDALVVTRSLTELPGKALEVPLLKNVFSEEFLFYYEANPVRLSLEGVFRRLAYEHGGDFADDFLRRLLDRPAWVALWKSRDGKLGDYLFVTGDAGLTPGLARLAEFALDDRQLRRYDTLDLGSGRKLPIYELRLGNRLLYFAGHRDRLLVFSSPALFQADTPARRAEVQALLAAPVPEQVLARPFGEAEAAAPHVVALSARYLGFGYQSFFPAWKGLKFRHDGSAWSGWLELARPSPAATGLWNRVPGNAAFCAALPVEPLNALPLLGRLLPETDARGLLAAVQSPAALCWYAESRLDTPLLVARADQAETLDGVLKSLFERSIGGREAGVVAEPGDPAAGRPRRVSYHPPFPVAETRAGNAMRLSRPVSSPYGLHPASGHPEAGAMRSPAFFRVALARHGDTLVFSADDRLVERAVATLERRYPSLADELPPDGDFGAVVVPRGLAGLAEAAVLESLPERQQAVFRAAVRERLLPVLAAFQSWPPVGLENPRQAGWQALAWRRLGSP